MRDNAPRDLSVDWAACQGHGLCAELLPDHITLDDWGYPIVSGPLSPAAAKRARRAVADCPALALKLRAAEQQVTIRSNPAAARSAHRG
ncbi:ferredoxin [Actinospica sp. MGRD01-02]|uniref:Ferredoxin n=1 Tax=Actinospica acidithermotolerans TaxID=2828514 RepID=A0A941EBD5_9ACTN|nr:ferredoxin [Actinospica acidithermotolerans]MBR7827343.1 ferredoxin [Actinospica acidithermotolerans]